MNLGRALFEESGYAFAIVLREAQAAHLGALQVELLVDGALGGIAATACTASVVLYQRSGKGRG